MQSGFASTGLTDRKKPPQAADGRLFYSAHRFFQREGSAQARPDTPLPPRRAKARRILPIHRPVHTWMNSLTNATTNSDPMNQRPGSIKFLNIYGLGSDVDDRKQAVKGLAKTASMPRSFQWVYVRNQATNTAPGFRAPPSLIISAAFCKSTWGLCLRQTIR